MAKKIKEIKEKEEIKESPGRKLKFDTSNLFKKKYIAVFLIKEQNTYSVLKKVRFQPDLRVIRFKPGNAHRVDIARPTYAKGLYLYYFFDIDKGQIYWEKDKDRIDDPSILDTIVKQNVVTQIVNSLGGKIGMNIMTLLMTFGLGGMIGFIIGFFVGGG